MSKKASNCIIFAIACFFTLWDALLLYNFANPLFVVKNNFAFVSSKNTAVSDFVNLYKAGLICLSEERKNVYDPEVQLKFTNQVISPEHISKVFFIQYVPFLFLIMAPFALFSITQAYSLWYFLSLFSFSISMFVLLGRDTRLSCQHIWLVIAAVLASAPAIITLKIGQLGFFVILLFSLAYRGLQTRSLKTDILLGIVLALFALKLQYLPLLVVATFASCRWRALTIALFCEIFLFAMSAFVLGFENILNYPCVLFRAETTKAYAGVNSEGMVSIRGILSQFLSGEIAILLTFIILMFAAYYIYDLWKKYSKNELSLEWAMTITVLMCLIVSPHSHVFDELLLVVPTILTLSTFSIKDIFSNKKISLIVWIVLLLIFPALSWFLSSNNLIFGFTIFNLALFLSGLSYLRTQKIS